MFPFEHAEGAELIASRTLVYGLVLLICGCVYFAQHTVQGACASSLDSPIRNFCVVTPQVLWRGERPNKTDATWLVEHRVGINWSLLDNRDGTLSQSLASSRCQIHPQPAKGDRRAEIMRKLAKWNSRLKASARIVCTRGKCTYSTINGAAAR
jgi:hypothetical protein